jgi:SWI/SNF-related matrix-associated actin-dependent regulator of chromatin subfamily A-like protein 1
MSDDYDAVFAALEAYESRRGPPSAQPPPQQQAWQQQQQLQQQRAPTAPLPPTAPPPPPPQWQPPYQQHQQQQQQPPYQQHQQQQQQPPYQQHQQQPAAPPWQPGWPPAGAPPPPPQAPPPGSAPPPYSVRHLFAGPPAAAAAAAAAAALPQLPPPYHQPQPQQQQHPQQPPYYQQQQQQQQQQPYHQQQQQQQQLPPPPPPSAAAPPPPLPAPGQQPLQQPQQHQHHHPPPPNLNLAYRAEMSLAEGGRLSVAFSGFHERLFAALQAVPGARRVAQQGQQHIAGGGGWQRAWSFPLSELPAVREASASVPGLTVTFSDLPGLVSASLDVARRLPDDSERFSRLDELQLGGGAADTLAARLMPFQRAGVRFALSRGGRALVGDEMGLGKTAQACALLLCYADEWPALVVVPSSLRDQWADALYGWLRVTEDRMLVAYKERDLDALDPFVAAARQAGQAAELRLRQGPGRVGAGALAAARAEAEASTFRSKCPFDAVVVSYDLMSREDKSGRLKACHFAVAAFDEAHYLKTPKSLRTKAALPVAQAARRLFLLSGTPVTSRPAELMPLLQMLLPDARITAAQFADRYCQGNQW